MSFTLERQLIETAYQAGMPVGSAIEFQNDRFVPTGNSYTRLSVMSGGEGRRVEVTATAHERVPGVIDVAIFVRNETGEALVRTIADQVTAALAYRTLQSGTTTLRTYGGRLDIIGESGDWFQGNVTIRFERDST
jgi:hypothetical protein